MPPIDLYVLSAFLSLLGCLFVSEKESCPFLLGLLCIRRQKERPLFSDSFDKACPFMVQCDFSRPFLSPPPSVIVDAIFSFE